jgi:hypothetical protein
MRVRILVTLLLACGTAQASEWISIGKTADGNVETFIDLSSIRVASGIRRVWIKSVAAPQTTKLIGSNKWASSVLTRTAFNCVEEIFRDEAQDLYFEDGTNTAIAPSSMDGFWRPAAPDTMYSAEIQFICAWGKK